jgi:hypothetical protein
MMLLAASHQLFAAVPVPLLTLVGLFLLPNQEEEKAGHRTMNCLGQLGIAGLGLLLAILMPFLWNSPLGAVLLILPAVFVVVIVWSVGQRYPRLTIVMAWLVLCSLFLLAQFVRAGWSMTALSPWWAMVWQIPFYVLPGFAVILAAVLIRMALQPAAGSVAGDDHLKQIVTGRRVLLLALAVLGCLAYLIYMGSVRDQARDGLMGLFLMGPASVTAVAASMVMAVSLKGKARLAGFLFMLFVPALLFGALVLPWYLS